MLCKITSISGFTGECLFLFELQIVDVVGLVRHTLSVDTDGEEQKSMNGLKCTMIPTVLKFKTHSGQTYKLIQYENLNAFIMKNHIKSLTYNLNVKMIDKKAASAARISLGTKFFLDRVTHLHLHCLSVLLRKIKFLRF